MTDFEIDPAIALREAYEGVDSSNDSNLILTLWDRVVDHTDQIIERVSAEYSNPEAEDLRLHRQFTDFERGMVRLRLREASIRHQEQNNPTAEGWLINKWLQLDTAVTDFDQCERYGCDESGDWHSGGLMGAMGRYCFDHASNPIRRSKAFRPPMVFPFGTEAYYGSLIRYLGRTARINKYDSSDGLSAAYINMYDWANELGSDVAVASLYILDKCSTTGELNDDETLVMEMARHASIQGEFRIKQQYGGRYIWSGIEGRIWLVSFAAVILWLAVTIIDLLPSWQINSILGFFIVLIFIGMTWVYGSPWLRFRNRRQFYSRINQLFNRQKI